MLVFDWKKYYYESFKLTNLSWAAILFRKIQF